MRDARYAAVLNRYRDIVFRGSLESYSGSRFFDKRQAKRCSTPLGRGADPNRWKPKIETVDRIMSAAERGLSISEIKGRVRGVKAIASPNTLINIRLWYPKRWAQLSEQFAKTKQLRIENKAILVRRVSAGEALDPQAAAELMQLAYRLMPRFVTGTDRDEAVQNLVTAVIFGELSISDVNAKTAKQFASKEASFSRSGFVSLDADLTGDGFTLLDTIQEEAVWNIPVSRGRRIGARRY